MTEQVADQGADSVEVPSPSDVAEEFGKGYYSTLSTKPQELHKFYKDDSVFTTLNEGSNDSDRIVGPDAIQEKLQASGLTSYRVRLPVFQAQESIDGSIFILAKGTFAKRDAAPRPFVQTFLLAPQTPSGWYVKNDILVFLKDETPAPVAAPAPAHSETKKATEPAHTAHQAPTASEPKAPAQSTPAPAEVKSERTTSQNGDSASPKVENRPEPVKKTLARVAKGKEKDDGEGKATEKPAATKTSWATITAANLPSEGAAAPGSTFPKPGSPKSTDVLTIRVRNLPFDASEQQISDLFSQFGSIAEIKVNRGYCFIEFDNAEGVKNAAAATDLAMDGRNLQVEEKKPKQMRRGVRADGKRVGMDTGNRSRGGGRGNNQGGKGGKGGAGGAGGAGRKNF